MAAVTAAPDAPLLVDALAFGAARLRSTQTVPWGDVAEVAHLHRTVAELLGDAVVTLPAGPLYAEWWSRREPPTASSRPAGALKAMLAEPGALEHLRAVVETIGDRAAVALEIPAPGRWAAEAAALLGGNDTHAPERAALYVAGWLRELGGSAVRLVVVGDADGVPAAALAPIANVAAHYRWRLATHGPAGNGGDLTLHAAPSGFWADGERAAGRPLHLRVPAEAEPARVLARLAAAREEVA